MPENESSSNEQHFSEKVKRYLNGQSTEEERLEMDEWLESLQQQKAYRQLSIQDLNESKAKMLSNILGEIHKDQNAKPALMIRIAWYSAAAILIFCMVGISYFLRSQRTTTEIATTDSIIKALPSNVQAVVYEGKQFIRMPDGSTAFLNDNSRLELQSGFNDNERKVTLTGEAFFDITHNSTKPFSVVSGKVITTVLGTAFNINAVNKNAVHVTVARGKVQVGDSNHVYGLITPNEQISVNMLNNTFTKSVIKAETAIEWKKSFLILEDVSMETAAALMEDRFHVKIRFENGSLKNCKLTAKFMHGESVEQVLGVITAIMDVTVRMNEDGTITLIGEGCQ